MTENKNKSKGIVESLKERYKYVRFIELYGEVTLEINLDSFKRCFLCSNVLEKDSIFLDDPKHHDKTRLDSLEMMLIEVYKMPSGEKIPIMEFINKK